MMNEEAGGQLGIDRVVLAAGRIQRVAIPRQLLRVDGKQLDRPGLEQGIDEGSARLLDDDLQRAAGKASTQVGDEVGNGIGMLPEL